MFKFKLYSQQHFRGNTNNSYLFRTTCMSVNNMFLLMQTGQITLYILVTHINISSIQPPPFLKFLLVTNVSICVLQSFMFLLFIEVFVQEPELFSCNSTKFISSLFYGHVFYSDSIFEFLQGVYKLDYPTLFLDNM